MNARLVRVLLAATALAGAALLLAGTGGAASAASTQPRVLAIRFGPDLEVNPVQSMHDLPGDRSIKSADPLRMNEGMFHVILFLNSLSLPQKYFPGLPHFALAVSRTMPDSIQHPAC